MVRKGGPSRYRQQSRRWAANDCPASGNSAGWPEFSRPVVPTRSGGNERRLPGPETLSPKSASHADHTGSETVGETHDPTGGQGGEGRRKRPHRIGGGGNGHGVEEDHRLRELLEALQAAGEGDFAVRLPFTRG